MPTKPLPLHFKEQSNVVFYHDLRVFIAGAEVTRDLQGRLSVSIADRDAPNTATFVLDNAFDKYVITAENAAGLYGVDPYSRYDEQAKKTLVDRKTGRDGKQTLQGQESTIKTVWNEVLDGMAAGSEGDDFDIWANNYADAMDEHFPDTSKPRQYNPSPKDKTLQTAVDRTVKRLNHEFFGAHGTDKTRLAVLREVVNTFKDASMSVSLEQMDKSIQSRTTGALDLASTEQITLKSIDRASTQTNPRDIDSDQLRYSFDVGDIVINKHDPVVVYAHNPFTDLELDAGGGQAAVWYPAFTGFINTVTETTDETTGTSSMTVVCYCIKALMKQMRLSLNAGLAVITPEFILTKEEGGGNFGDVVDKAGTAMATAITNISLEATVEKLITGGVVKTNQDAAEGQQGTNDAAYKNRFNDPKGLQLGRVGGFEAGVVIRYPATDAGGQNNSSIGIPSAVLGAGSPASVAALERWHQVSIFGDAPASSQQPGEVSQRSDVGFGTGNRFNGGFLTFDEVSEAGGSAYVGGENDPWARRVHFLLPARGTNVNTLAQTVFDTQQNQYQFHSRGEILQEAVRKLDYQLLTSPAGDLLLEFPMYDFVPEDFGYEWGNLFSYYGHLMDSTVTPEEEYVPAGLVVQGTISNVAGGDVTLAESILKRVLVLSRLVWARYGIGNIETLMLPHIQTMDQLKAYGLLFYQKKLMEASRMSFSAAHRPFLMPNRPILHARRGRLSITNNVEHSWEIFKNATTELSMKGVRKRLVEDGKIVYRFVTGGSSMAISYRAPVSGPQELVGPPDPNNPDEKNALTPGPEVRKAAGLTIKTDDDQAGPQSTPTAPENVVFKHASGLSVLDPETQSVLRKIAACVAPTKIKINSTLRDEKEQKKLAAGDSTGKVSPTKSQHLHGKAFDIDLQDHSSDTVSKQLSKADIKKIAQCTADSGYIMLAHKEGQGSHIHIQQRENPSSNKTPAVKDELGVLDKSDVTEINSSRFARK